MHYKQKQKMTNAQVKGVLWTLGVLTLLFIGSFFIGYQRIDAGYDGIRVNRYGDQKGVDQVTEVTGAVWYNPLTHEIYEVPTYVQDYSLQNMTFKTKDMMDATLSVGLQLAIPSGQSPGLFVKYRRYFSDGTVDLTELIQKNTFTAFSDAVGKYKAEELLTKKQEFRETASKIVVQRLTDVGFNISEAGVFLTGDPKLPDGITAQVNAKIEADQIAQRKESELRQTQADALKLAAKAEGEAKARMLKADAERYEYEQKNKVLNELLVKQQWIDKWNGVLPVYGDPPMLWKSSN